MRDLAYILANPIVKVANRETENGRIINSIENSMRTKVNRKLVMQKAYRLLNKNIVSNFSDALKMAWKSEKEIVANNIQKLVRVIIDNVYVIPSFTKEQLREKSATFGITVKTFVKYINYAL